MYEEGIRGTAPVNDKFSSRGKDGRKSNRKCSINRMTDASLCCNLRITISLCDNKKGFFIKPGFGCNIHRNHAPTTNGKDCSYHSSTMAESKSNHNYLNNLMTNGVSGTSAARMMMRSKPQRNLHITRHQAVYYAHQIHDNINRMMDSSSKLVEYLESLDNVSSSILYHEIENH